jgi:hypothetical protein
MGVVEVLLQAFLTSALDAGGQLHALAMESDASTHFIAGWMGPRAGLDAVVKRKIPYSCWESNTGRPFCSSVITLTELHQLFSISYCQYTDHEKF